MIYGASALLPKPCFVLEGTMKKSTGILKVISLFLGIINTLLFFSLRNCWSGISKTLNYEKNNSTLILYLPVIVCVLFLLVFISELVVAKISKNPKCYPLAYTIVEVIFTAVIVVVVMFGGQKYVRFAVPHFLKYLAVCVLIQFLYYLLYRYPDSKLKNCWLVKALLVGAASLGALLFFTKFGFNSIACGPVVYAVEDEYQIVFSGGNSSIGSVIIDGVEYKDLYAGSERSKDRIHKVCVPMEVLDKAGKYTVSVQRVIYRGPFGGILGKTATKDYSFRAVDTSDGFKYFCLSDVHANIKQAVKTASYVEDMDLLVIDGDMLSMVDAYRDANFVNELCSEITNGSIPVIYARGNHECKGDYSEDLYRFVGSKNQKFYYRVNLNGVYCLVLDIGEDHDDNWWEYYGAADFDSYRAEQMRFLETEYANGAFENNDYNMVVCHIPIVFVNSRKNHTDIKKALTEQLNRMEIDMALYAHQHDLFVFEPDTVASNEPLTYNPAFKSGTYKGYLTDFNFFGLMISKPGYTQNPKDEDESSHIGLVVEADFINKRQNCYYLNSLGEMVSVVNPFAEIDYGKEIEFPLK